MLGHEVTKAPRRATGLPDDTIDITFTGSAGRASARSCPSGVTLRLFGDANDYVGKGLSGGRLVVRPPSRDADFVAEDNIIAGNVIGYGATGGEIFLRGRSGSGSACATPGPRRGRGRGRPRLRVHDRRPVVVLGPTGRNFGAGMSGGIAYVWTPRAPASTRDGRRARSSTTSTRRGSSTALPPPPEPTGSEVAAGCWRTGRRPAQFARCCPATTSGSSTPSGRRRGRTGSTTRPSWPPKMMEAARG
jgi:hypothetical protein